MRSVRTPREIVQELDKHIIGQNAAKRAVAIAVRNRWRRMQLDDEMRDEVTPKNILMIGPTGVGKTEIARRLAKLVDAPFIKIEATKFTEVGYVGRDVESIIRDLADVSVKMQREHAMNNVAEEAKRRSENRILNVLVPAMKSTQTSEEDEPQALSAARTTFREKLRKGELDDKEIEIELEQTHLGVEVMAPPGMEEMTSQLTSMLSQLTEHKTKPTRLKIEVARRRIAEEEAMHLIDDEEVKANAIRLVEQAGIVFLDELDKVAKRSEFGADVSREGVQRDLLPLIEGSTVNTKYGMVRTDHILFIASGAFHLSKPSDLIPELQGRLPIRVELSALSPKDFNRILTEPDHSITEQYQALMATEGIKIAFSEKSLDRISELAWQVNENTENIGARRLHTVMERLLDDISFNSCENDKQIEITDEYVDQQLKELVKNQDLSNYIL